MAEGKSVIDWLEMDNNHWLTNLGIDFFTLDGAGRLTSDLSVMDDVRLRCT